MERSQENVIEWLTGDDRVGMTLSQTKWINRISKLKASHPEEVGLIVNEDGSAFASVPLPWIKVSAPRQLSQEQREKLAERIKEVRPQR